MTKDLQKKQCCYIKTGRKDGSTRGLAEVPSVAIEVPKGHFNNQVGSSWEKWVLSPKPGSPVRSTRTRKFSQITSVCEKQWSFCPPGRDDYRCSHLLKRITHKILFASSYKRLQWREGRVDYSYMSRFWNWWLWGESWRVTCYDPCTQPFPVIQKPSFLGCALPSMWLQPGGSNRTHAIAHLPHPVELNSTNEYSRRPFQLLKLTGSL